MRTFFRISSKVLVQNRGHSEGARSLVANGREREKEGERGGGKIVGSRPVELQTQQFFALDDALAI